MERRTRTKEEGTEEGERTVRKERRIKKSTEKIRRRRGRKGQRQRYRDRQRQRHRIKRFNASKNI